MNDLAVKIRDAVPVDASAACRVMQQSIAELCLIDHRNDPVILERWPSNKTPEIFKSWIRPGNALLVAIEDGKILAVGPVTDAGEITLNYVSPDARFRGVSTKLPTALERRAIERGNPGCTLKSTETARCFYLARGYPEEDGKRHRFGLPDVKMSGHLNSSNGTASAEAAPYEAASSWRSQQG